ncbi:multiple organellar RNA editing factor 1, mitochondrial isoform X2 [Drosophila willistoni]|uniref:multiple organellar RNA editing factor 1, mitochondrial isoform X2 n=1 Tax=Drosophila willistoni TaxID=7260 RepID=UPI001F08372C|nr:multiple organellar RNA editing factor 1, mitochondrial isoform X2 [Drosophila willistoni]
MEWNRMGCIKYSNEKTIPRYKIRGRCILQSIVSDCILGKREFWFAWSINSHDSCHSKAIPTTNMDQRATAIGIVLLCLCAGTSLAFQDKAPVQHSLIPGQSRTDKQQVLEDPLGSGRGIDENLLKTIEEQHGRQYGYGYGGYNHPPTPYQPWPVYPQPPPPPPPPQRPWTQPPPPPPTPPYYQWYGGQWGNYGGYGYDYYPGYSGYPGYPYYPYYRASSNAQAGDNGPGSGPGDIVPPPTAGFQARYLSATNNLIDGKGTQNVLPLYHLLNMSRP